MVSPDHSFNYLFVCEDRLLKMKYKKILLMDVEGHNFINDYLTLWFFSPKLFPSISIKGWHPVWKTVPLIEHEQQFFRSPNSRIAQITIILDLYVPTISENGRIAFVNITNYYKLKIICLYLIKEHADV